MRPSSSEAVFNYGLIATLVALAVYSVFVASGLLTGRVPVERAYGAMILLPFATALWQGFSFVRTAQRAQHRTPEWSLLVSSLGWACLALALLFLGRASGQISTVATILTTIGALLLVGGVILALTYKPNLNDNGSRF